MDGCGPGLHGPAAGPLVLGVGVRRRKRPCAIGRGGGGSWPWCARPRGHGGTCAASVRMPAITIMPLSSCNAHRRVIAIASLFVTQGSGSCPVGAKAMPASPCRAYAAVYSAADHPVDNRDRGRPRAHAHMHASAGLYARGAGCPYRRGLAMATGRAWMGIRDRPHAQSCVHARAVE